MLAMNQSFAGLAIAAAMVGLLECFFGYRILRVMLALAGFGFGGVAAYTVVKAAGQSDQTAMIAGLVSGLAGAGLLTLFYFAGVFIIGAGFGLALAVVVGRAFSIEGPTVIGLAVGMALAGGILALVVQRLLIIIATSFGGAAAAIQAIRALFFGQSGLEGLDLSRAPSNFEELRQLAEKSYSALTSISNGLLSDRVSAACILAIGIAGVVVQCRISRKNKSSAAQQRPA